MADVTGTSYIQMDGFMLESKDGQASLDFGGVERAPVYANKRLLGPAEKAVACTVGSTLAHTAITDVAKINNAKNVTITFITDTGKRYVVRNAFCTKPCKLAASDNGDLEVEFMGQPAVEA